MTSTPSSPPAPGSRPDRKTRLVCFVNGIFADGIGGGDVYFAHIARAALNAGHPLHFFGGHVFRRYLERQGLPLDLTLTDDGPGKLGDVNSLGGQFRLLFDFARRLRGSLRRLDVVQDQDLAYAMSDYWFDSIPLMRCRARAKVLYLGMIAPTLWQVITRGRADVTASRLASLYYWMSQQFSLRLFRFCRGHHVTYSHPEMREYLLRFGYKECDLSYVANGMDTAFADSIPEQTREYDLVWTGRVHPQKGIDDLLAALAQLSKRIPDFRALIIGKSRETLELRIRELGIAANVTFTGLVSEEEKFRLLKKSRVFAMPSRYESWGIVVGEALASGVPVVAYELQCYRPVFGEFVRYVKPFDCDAFVSALEREIGAMRAGNNYLAGMDLPGMKRSLSWASAQQCFVDVLSRMERLACGA